MSDLVTNVGKAFLGNMVLHDTFVAENKVLITIECPNRSRDNISKKTGLTARGRDKVVGFISSDIALNITSHWESILGAGGGSGSNFVDGVNKWASSVNGVSVQQPWFARQYWKSTDPFDFTFDLKFVADTNAEEEVWYPIETLASFCYPRSKQDVGAVIGKNLDTLAGQNSLGLEKLLEGLVQEFHIPGPSSLFPNNKSGDWLRLKIGNFIAYEGCYIKDLNIKIKPTIAEDGFPMYAEASVKMGVLEALYVNKDGSFALGKPQFKESPLAKKLKAEFDATVDGIKKSGFFKG